MFDNKILNNAWNHKGNYFKYDYNDIRNNFIGWLAVNDLHVEYSFKRFPVSITMLQCYHELMNQAIK